MEMLSKGISELKLLTIDQSNFIKEKFHNASENLNTNTKKFDWFSQLL
jgi:hypothetical protein